MPDRCRLCGENTAIDRTGSAGGLLILEQECPTCGRWKAPLDTVGADLSHPANAWLLPYLAAHIRQSNEAGERVVELTAETWRREAEDHARTPISRKLDRLLRRFEAASHYAGDYVLLTGDIYPLVDAKNGHEVAFLRESLASQGLLEPRPNRQIESRISAKGWDYLYPLTAGGTPGTCFVAMSFDPTLADAFDQGIRRALEDDCGFLANRVDRTAHNDNITTRIMAGIRSSQFLVADFTLQRQGVYYEAGFAEGLGRTVIRTCRADDFENLHFDTRQFFHLKWERPAELRTLLADHVRATIGSFGAGRMNGGA